MLTPKTPTVVTSNDKKPVTAEKEIQTIENKPPRVLSDEICIPFYMETSQSDTDQPVPITLCDSKLALQPPPQPIESAICGARPYVVEEVKPICCHYNQPMFELYVPHLYDHTISQPVTLDDDKPNPGSALQPIQTALCEAELCIADPQKTEPIFHYNHPTIELQPPPIHNTAIIQQSPCVFQAAFTPVSQQAESETLQMPESNLQESPHFTCIHQHSPYGMGPQRPVQVKVQHVTQSATTQTDPEKKQVQPRSQLCEYSPVACQRFKQHHQTDFRPCLSPLHKKTDGIYLTYRAKRKDS